MLKFSQNVDVFNMWHCDDRGIDFLCRYVMDAAISWIPAERLVWVYEC